MARAAWIAVHTCGVERNGREHGVDHPHIGQVQQQPLHTRLQQAGSCQFDHFEIGFQSGMPVDFRTELQRFAAGERAVDAGVHHRSAVAQAGHTLAVQQVGVDAGHLRRAVGAQAKRAARQLIHQFEGLQIECLTGPGEQRFQMLQQRRHDQLVAVASGCVQQTPAEFFDVARLGGQDIGNVIREDPG